MPCDVSKQSVEDAVCENVADAEELGGEEAVVVLLLVIYTKHPTTSVRMSQLLSAQLTNLSANRESFQVVRLDG
jgi:hypothetical protein